MEFSQPTGFYHNGLPTYGQTYAFSTPPPFQFNGYPEIIGEGNVTSVISPDGSTQFLFMPTAQWPIPYVRHPYVGSCNNPLINTLGAWLIRSIYNPLQPPVFSQTYQAAGGHLNPRIFTSDCCLNLPISDFALKFHNDNSTSTSDIHYFFPIQYDWFRQPKQCAAIQVEVPLGEVHCSRPCMCKCAAKLKCKCDNDKRKQKCLCFSKSHTSNSAMSIEELKSDLNDHKKSREKKPHKFKRTKSKPCCVQCKCEHKGPTRADKYVTTFVEQASGRSVDANGRETQTGCHSGSIPVREINSGDFICTPEIWKPKTPMTKKTFTIKSSGSSEDSCGECCTSSVCFSSN